MFKFENNKSFDEMKNHFQVAANEGHPNSENYSLKNMEKRWGKYLTFSLLTYDNNPLAFAGVYDWGNNLVRVCDRYYVFPFYRNNNLSYAKRPANNYVIPKQHEYAVSRGYECFFSIQTVKKRRAMMKSVEKVEYLGFKLLDGLYATCNPKCESCWQNIASTTNNINLLYNDV